MQYERASRTALLIAGSLLLLHHDAKRSRLVSKSSADLCAHVLWRHATETMAPVLEKHASQTRLFAKIVRQTWFRSIAKLIERITIPGILLHYAFRKKCTSDLARSALANGVAHGRIRVNSVHVSRIMHRRSATKSMVMSRVSPSPKFYVPRADLPDFLAQAVDLLRSNRTTVIYGTVRLIEKDDRAFLHGPKNPTPV